MSFFEAEMRIREVSRLGSLQLDLSNLNLGKKMAFHQDQYDFDRLMLPKQLSTNEGLKNLKTLNLANNGFTRIPFSIEEGLKNLTVLNLSENDLTAVPSWIGRLENLKELNLAGNKLTTMPRCILDLENLTSINLSGNTIDLSHPLAYAYARRSLRNLTSLNLSGNALTKLPSWIGKLKNLDSLILSHNGLSEIPLMISQLKNLKSLNLSVNELGHIPSWIGSLKKLMSLDISENALTNLPTEIGELENLKMLYLNENLLSILPSEICRLNHLSLCFEDDIFRNGLGINFYGNEDTLEHPPVEVLEQGWDAVENYFKQSEEQSLDKLYEAKLVLIGEGRAGKTSLMKALMKEGFDPQEKTTHGINVRSMILTPEETGLDRDFRLNLWDFGGQDIYKDTHRFFLTKDTIYLLVTEKRKNINFDDIYYWLNSIKQFAPQASVLLAQNKSELSGAGINFENYRTRFKNLVPWSNLIHTSCVDGKEHTIQELKRNVVEIIKDDKLKPSVGDELPAKWILIREEILELQKQGKVSIGYDEFKTLCSNYGLTQRDVKTLSGYFFRIGVFTHYAENLLLSKQVFLSSEWLTQGVYRIVDDPKILKQQGRFSRDDLRKMYMDTIYQGQEAEFLELMKEFKICYQLRNGDFLSPLLLPEQTPKDFDWAYWQKEDTLHFAFDYKNFMPKGILSTFIVDMHQDIKNELVWKNGVVLSDQENEALIFENIEKKQIDIVIKGKDKRLYLAIVTKAFQIVHKELNDLPHEGKLACHCSMCSQSWNDPYFYDAETIFRRLMNKKVLTVPCGKSDEIMEVAALAGELAVLPTQQDSISKEDLLRVIANLTGTTNNFYAEAQGIFGGEGHKKNKFGQDNRNQSSQVNVNMEALSKDLDKLTTSLALELTKQQTPQLLNLISLVGQAKAELNEGNHDRVATALNKSRDELINIARKADTQELLKALES